MFRCKDISQKVSQSMDAALPLPQRMAVWLHLLMCRYCFRFWRQLFMLRKMSRRIDSGQLSVGTSDRLSQEAKERLKKTLRSFS